MTETVIFLATVLCAASAVAPSATFHANGLPNVGLNAVRIKFSKITAYAITPANQSTLNFLPAMNENNFADRADQVPRISVGGARRDNRGWVHPAAAPHPPRTPEGHRGRKTGGAVHPRIVLHLRGPHHQRPGKKPSFDPGGHGLRRVDRQPEGFHLLKETPNARPLDEQTEVLEFQVGFTAEVLKNVERFGCFSNHEIGVYDMPAFVDYVLGSTGKDELVFVGHSHGTTLFFIFASERPEYNKKIRLSVMLAPVTYTSKIFNPIGRILGDLLDVDRVCIDYIVHSKTNAREFYVEKRKLKFYMCANF